MPFRVLFIILITGSALGATHAQAQDQGSMLDQALALAASDASGSASGRWDGGHVGGFLAYTRSGLYDSSGPIEGLDSFEGWMAGLDAGVDFTLDGGVVAGVVGDIAWADIAAVDPVNGDVGRIGWAGSVRGRVGIDAGTFLPYVTAGLAMAGAEFDSEDGLETVSGTHMGWTVGLGVEAALSEQISIDLLYRYSDYGTVDYAYTSPGPATVKRGLTAHQLSLGLNFAF